MIKNIYIQKSSIIHNVDFWPKFIVFLILFPLTAFMAKTKILILLGIILVAIIIASKIDLKKFLREIKNYVIPITIGITILALFFRPGSINVRLLQGAELSLRFALLIAFGIFFSMVTNPIEIPVGFLRAKIPHKYGVTLMVGYRMMPLISRKITTIIQAQKARGASFRPSLKKINKFFLQLTSLIIPSIYATLDMSVKLSDALISRGYNPEGKITVPTKKWNIYDFCLISLSVLILIVSLIK